MALPTLPTPLVTYNWGPALNAYLEAIAPSLAEPAGMIKAFGGFSAPAGWALCNGATVSRGGTYANLFAAIGTRYGTGDGSSTFTLPNFKGRALVGIDSRDARFDPPQQGMYGGAKTHTLSGIEIPYHTHDMSHGHGWSGSASFVNAIGYASTAAQDFGPELNEVLGTPITFGNVTWSYTGSVPHTPLTTGGAGGGLPHTNLMPYGLLNYIISLGN